jgi:hypothetical protein
MHTKKLQNVALHFVCGYGLSSLAIARWGVQVPEFSHVDLVLAPGTYAGVEYPKGALLGARDDAIGDRPPGVWPRPPAYEKWRRQTTVTFKADPSYAQSALEWALNEISHKYDEDAIWSFIFGQRWHKKGAWICSVFGGNFLLRAHIIQGTPRNLQGTPPNTLYAVSLAVGGLIS